VRIDPDPARFSTAAALGPEPLSDAGALRDDGPPSWMELVDLVSASR
jgi:hypothetical protein